MRERRPPKTFENPARRRTKTPRRRAPKKKPAFRRRRGTRLAALVARKIEEHARLAQDAVKIAIAIALLAMAFLLANAFYQTLRESQPAPAGQMSGR
jgi:hypothetical protein